MSDFDISPPHTHSFPTLSQCFASQVEQLQQHRYSVKSHFIYSGFMETLLGDAGENQDIM